MKSPTKTYTVVVQLPSVVGATVSRDVEVDCDEDTGEVDPDVLEETCRDVMYELISWDYKEKR